MNFFAVLLFLELVAIATIDIRFCSGSSYVGCIESERQALLRFKQDLIDPSNRLASWIGDDGDCCTWAGVVCNNSTGHVLELNLRNPYSMDFMFLLERSYIPMDAEYQAYQRSILGGKINPSLLDFKHLIYLDLSGNNFQGIHIPSYLGSVRNLRYLNLSTAGFIGMIPPQLGNLSNLQHLDLGIRGRSLYVENLSWLTSLSLLKHLDLSGVNISKSSDWLQVTNSLPSLEVLQLSGCQLNRVPPPASIKFSSLATLDLSSNQFAFNSLIPSWVFGLSHLVFLDLSFNNIQGPLPDGLQNLTSLRHLDLSLNHFNSSIPSWFYRFSHLQYLSLRSNSLKGTMPSQLGNLTSLEVLDLSTNKLEGRIPRSLERLCNSRSIYFSNLILNQEISEILEILSACVADRLESLELVKTQVFGQLTNQLGHFKSLHTLFTSFNSISGPVPPSLGQLASMRFLDISSNKLNGTLSEIHFANLSRLSTFDASRNSLSLKVNPDWVPSFQIKQLRLMSSDIGPQFPLWLESQKFLFYLDISNTGIVDTIPNRFWKSLSQTIYLNLSHNQIHGEIANLVELAHLDSLDLSSNNLSGPLPLISSNVTQLDLSNNSLTGYIFSFLCNGTNELRKTQILNLKDNFLSGELPDCWMNWKYLLVLNLGNNQFTGSLPNSIGTLSSLRSLALRENNLVGTLPVSLKNCTELVALSVGQNGFSGTIPTWIGEIFSKMIILNLRSNKFYGVLPTELCRLASLQILDLAYNNLSGTIPSCINNFSAMVTMSYSRRNNIKYLSNTIFGEDIVEGALLVMKGKSVEYSTILNLVRSLDLSKNNFSGEIPMEVTDLVALRSLNLSYNHFNGRIPESIGAMRSLEAIDFSNNNLSDKIPEYFRFDILELFELIL